MAKEILDLFVEGGNAKPGPTTAPRLAQFKINMSQLFNDINEKTKEYKGMNVPVKVEIDTNNGSYSIRVGVPPVASLIKKEMGVPKFGVEKKEKVEEVKVEEKKPEKEEKSKAAVPETETPAAPVVEEPKPEKKEKIIYGNLTIDQAIRIAKMKRESLLSKTMKGALKEVVAACVSMPITVEGKGAKEVLQDIDDGIYDDKLK